MELPILAVKKIGLQKAYNLIVFVWLETQACRTCWGNMSYRLYAVITFRYFELNRILIAIGIIEKDNIQYGQIKTGAEAKLILLRASLKK